MTRQAGGIRPPAALGRRNDMDAGEAITEALEKQGYACCTSLEPIALDADTAWFVVEDINSHGYAVFVRRLNAAHPGVSVEDEVEEAARAIMG